MPIPLMKKSKNSPETLLFPQNELSQAAEKDESFHFEPVVKEVTGSESKRAIPFKKDPIELNQSVLFPSNIFDLLPEDHYCFVYDELFKLLDTSIVESNYHVLGQNAYHPRLIAGIFIYAYSNGVFSVREIAKKCNEDLGFMFISHKNCPDFRVLNDFRKNNKEFLHECFKQTVLLAMEAGMVSLGHVSLDGSKFKADTSKHKAMSYKHLKEKEKELVGEIEELIAKGQKCDEEEDKEYQDKTGYELPEDLKFKEKRLAKIRAAKEALEKREEEINPGKKIEEKKQISFADKEARIMGKNGDFDYSYNGQISVDSGNQIIVGQHLSQNANDKKEVESALKEIKESAGQLPKAMSLDNGYMSGNNLESIQEIDTDVFIATNKGEKKNKIPLDDSARKLEKPDFIYNKEDDSFICPADNLLELKSEHKDGKKTYQAEQKACSQCNYNSRCCQSLNGAPRTISTDNKEPLRLAMNEKMELEESKKIYKKRKVIVEPVFGQIKNNGFRGFSLRGFEKVKGEFSLVCAVHNFKKIAKAILVGKVCLEAGKLVEIAI